jgi:hypothetical protein
MREILLVSLIGLASLPVLAETTTTGAPITAPASTANPLDPAWQELERKVSTFIGQQKQREMLDMAYAEVAADACPGIKLNGAAINSALDVMGANTGNTRTPEAQRRFEHEMMIYVGVYTGLVLAESFQDRELFCKQVWNVNSRKGGPTRFWSAESARSR